MAPIQFIIIALSRYWPCAFRNNYAFNFFQQVYIGNEISNQFFVPEKIVRSRHCRSNRSIRFVPLSSFSFFPCSLIYGYKIHDIIVSRKKFNVDSTPRYPCHSRHSSPSSQSHPTFSRPILLSPFALRATFIRYDYIYKERKKERKKGEKLGNDVSDKFRRVVQWRYRSSRRERKKETTKSSATSSLLFPPSFNREKRTTVSIIDTFARELLPRVIIR